MGRENYCRNENINSISLWVFMVSAFAYRSVVSYYCSCPAQRLILTDVFQCTICDSTNYKLTTVAARLDASETIVHASVSGRLFHFHPHPSGGPCVLVVPYPFTKGSTLPSPSPTVKILQFH